jgi:hypothetical protein
MLSVLTSVYDASPTFRKVPFSHPVSLSRSSLKWLPYGYVMSPKADGTRAMLWLVIHNHQIRHAWLLYRDTSARVLVVNNDTVEHDVLDPSTVSTGLIHPDRVHPNDLLRQTIESDGGISLSVFDVEVTPLGALTTVSTVPEQPRLYIFDAIVVCGKSCVKICPSKRMTLAHHVLTDLCDHQTTVVRHNTCCLTGDPRLRPFMFPAVTSGVHVVQMRHDQTTTLLLIVKPTFHTRHYSAVNAILADRVVNHPATVVESIRNDEMVIDMFAYEQLFDGTVFTRLKCRLSPFTSEPRSFIKYKPSSRITVDLLVTPLKVTSTAITFTSGVPEKFTTATTGNVMLSSTPKTMINSSRVHVFARGRVPVDVDISVPFIAEFEWSSKSGEWVYVRARPRKLNPNALKTIVATIRNITDVISTQQVADTLSVNT